MSEIYDLIKKIAEHCDEEKRGGYSNLTIGQGEITLKGQTRTIWILNTQPRTSFALTRNITGDVNGTFKTNTQDHYHDKSLNSLEISKNKEYARIILNNYQGTHSCLFADQQLRKFIIKNSAHYNHTRTSVNNIYVGIGSMVNWAVFSDLDEALFQLKTSENALIAKKKAMEEAIAKQKQEEIERLNREIELEEQRKSEILNKALQAKAFIHEQFSLRRNPILDTKQDAAKFSNIYNGVAVIINGGPGTGKTTTIIQRLKLLIDPEDLKDYILNHSECKLTKEQIEVIAQNKNNWIFFSPNELLKKYLQDNMSYEGLINVNQQTEVWKKFLRNVVRDDYHLAGPECPFDFSKKSYREKTVFIGKHLEIIQEFIDFYINSTKTKILKISKFDSSKFSWNVLGKLITNECGKIENINTVIELIKFFINLKSLDAPIPISKGTLPSATEIAKKHNKELKDLTDIFIQKIKADSNVSESIETEISLQLKNNDQEDEAEEMDENENFGDRGIALFNSIRRLLKKLILKKYDSSEKLSKNQKKLYEIIQPLLNEEELDKYVDSAVFVKHIYPAMKGIQQSIFTPIPQIYKQFRKKAYNENYSKWSPVVLKYIFENKNKPLLDQEQDLLVGFINDTAQSLYKVSKELFTNSSHRYVTAYKNLCRPAIGIDEATDYCILDYYCIKSFGHYLVSSFTLCGDIMQLMKTDGISNWNKLKHPLLFQRIDIHELTMSYRQSPELLKLANHIYETELRKKSPYECYFQRIDSPKPLWIESEDIEEKATWIADRVLEINKVYDQLPTIAIFTKDVATAEKLRENLEECTQLENAGIDVKVCIDSDLGDSKTLRLFPIDQVKGMEFEAVFFYDIDDIESSSLINKYIYVGLSRASMYLAVTSNGHSSKISEMLKENFQTDTHW